MAPPMRRAASKRWPTGRVRQIAERIPILRSGCALLFALVHGIAARIGAKPVHNLVPGFSPGPFQTLCLGRSRQPKSDLSDFGHVW